MLSSVCTVHGAVFNAGVEVAAVMVEVVARGGGDEVVIATGVVTAEVNGWRKSPIGPDTVVTAVHRSDSTRLITGVSLRHSGDSQT